MSRIGAVVMQVLSRPCAELNVGDASHVTPAFGVWWEMGVVIAIHAEIGEGNWFQGENGNVECKSVLRKDLPLPLLRLHLIKSGSPMVILNFLINSVY